MDSNGMVSKNLVKAAELIAELAHKDQTDEAGVPYVEHPRFVAGLLETPEQKIVGFLHDVVEDTDVTLEKIRPIFGNTITEAIELMTKDSSEDYFDYVRRLSTNPLARKVKLADLTHNMDLSRIKVITEKQVKRKEKYKKAYDFLMEIEQKEHA